MKRHAKKSKIHIIIKIYLQMGPLYGLMYASYI
jgi:hypothetical protein